MSIPSISSFFETHLPILEKYWLSNDKQQYLESLTNQTDKKLISLLVNPLPQNYEEVFKELKIPSNIRSELLNSKILTAIRKAEGQAKSKAVERYVTEYFKDMNFQFPKPVENTNLVFDSTANEKNEQKEDNSKLILQQNLAKYLEDLIAKDKNNFTTLNEFGIKQLREEYLLNMHIDNRKWLISRSDIFVSFKDEFVVKLLLSYAEQVAIVKKVPFYQEISESWIESLTKSQINLLKSTKPEIMNNPVFVRSWFELNYLNQIQEEQTFFTRCKTTISELDERRKKLVAIRDQIKKIGSSLLKPYENHLFYEILVLDLKRQDPEKQLFYEFLRNIEGVSAFFNKDFREVIKNKFGQYKSIQNYSAIRSPSILSNNYNVEKLIGNYLKKLFKKYKNIEELKTELNKYIDFNIVNNHHAKVKLEEGEQLLNLHEILQKTEIEELKKIKQITIVTEKTQKFFKAHEEVVLAIRLKNIRQMKLKVYEMNIEQYYLENPGQQIDETINLQYLNPTHEELIEIKDFKNSYQVIEQQLLVDKIPKACGFYIVELVGEGITSRAVIRKGAIACFEQSHIDGKLLKFYDESGHAINNIKVWVNGRSQVLAKGEYLLPFSKNGEEIKVLAVRDTYAERFDIYVDRESYSFDVGMIYNHESFIVGKKSKVILHPVLKLGDKKVSLLNMQNIKVTANLINNQNIKSSERFQNVKFSDDKDYILQIPIKSYTRSISIFVEGEVKDLEEKVINLSFNKTIGIELMEGTTNFIDMYLKRTNKGKHNVLKVRGFNGEAMSNLDVNLNLSFYGTSQTLDKVLKTNSDGQLLLGSFEYVSSVKASINTSFGTISRTWNLNTYVDEIAFCGRDFIYHEEDEIIIPLPFDWKIDEKNIHQFLTFMKKEDNSYHSMGYLNVINKIKIINHNSTTYLNLGKLNAGSYNLSFLKINNKNVVIQTLEGKKWANGAIFSEKKGIVQNINQSPSLFVSLGDLKEEKGETQNTRKITIPINIPNHLKEKIEKKSIRAHILMKNNSDSADQKITEAFNLRKFSTPTEFREQSLSYKVSNYYSNKTLSDEQAYVLNRENEKQFIGNNLQKPRIFLKRIEVRDTTQNQEQLNNEGGYRDECDQFGGGGGGGGEMCKKKMRGASNRAMDCMGGFGNYVLMEYNLNSHNNFFALSGHCLLNSKYHEKLEFTAPSGYNEVVVYLISDHSAIKKTFYLNEESVQQNKDLKHHGLKDANETKGWSMSRQIYQLQKGEKRQISRDSLWCTVSLSNILQFAQIKGYKLPSWISQWRSYSEAKKLQVYDKEVCHQLNVFLKHHDVEFFKKIVEPFIRNKITITFVDLCLLGDKDTLQYALPHKIQNLNQFEKVLLIESLVENGQKSEAMEIATSMDLQQKSVKRSFQTYKELFDIVLNSEAGSTKPKLALQNQSQPLSDAFAFGFAPPSLLMAPSAQMYMSRSIQPEMMRMQEMQDEDECMAIHDDNQSQSMSYAEEKAMDARSSMRMLRKKRDESERTYKPGFKEVEKTKEYTETTYAGMKNPKQSINLIPQNLFWAHIANYLASSNKSKSFLSEAFLFFNLPIEFTLACCFISNEPNADYELGNEGDNFVIEANNSFMLFVKEVKELDYSDKFGVLINQRFFNPLERYTYEDDGTQIQKLVDEFLVKKVYTLQTVVTNTSGTNLELQLLMDIPSGAIPLMSHEYVQIINVNINSFSTTSFERHFYFPSEGTYTLYPANASRNNVVIAKAKKLPEMQVKLSPTVNKLESFNDVMRSGSKKEILEYIEKRNIFDPKIFNSYSILWMLKDKEFFDHVINVLRRRNFYDAKVWSVGIYHKDPQLILEYIESSRQTGLKSADIPIFEYFPYFSRRTHKFMDENKSTIRNVQFKETYKNFVISTLLEGEMYSAEKTAFAYYLMLQDRIDECADVFKSLTEEERKAHQIQTDYLACYLSMYQDYPNFTTAQTISEKYQNYPIATWNKMFKEIYDTLKEYHQDVELEEESLKRPATEFRTTFVNEGDNLKINIPQATKVEVYFYDINLELYFSDYPFDQVHSLSVVKPKESKVFGSGESRDEKINFTEVQHLGNMIVEIYEFKEGVPALKIGSFFWANPKIKVRIIQNEGKICFNSGTLQVFYDGKKQTGCYVKVYSSGSKGQKFYRDGYTDITGKFKYALADLEGLTQFSILAMTKQGGVINQVSPPSTAGYY